MKLHCISEKSNKSRINLFRTVRNEKAMRFIFACVRSYAELLLHARCMYRITACNRGVGRNCEWRKRYVGQRVKPPLPLLFSLYSQSRSMEQSTGSLFRRLQLRNSSPLLLFFFLFLILCGLASSTACLWSMIQSKAFTVSLVPSGVIFIKNFCLKFLCKMKILVN